MYIASYLRSCVALLLLAVSSTSLVIPASLIAPFSIPDVMQPNTLEAVQLAVGTRLLSMLGSLGIGSVGSLATSLLGGGVPGQLGGGVPGLLGGGQMFSQRSGQMDMYGYDGPQNLTPRNKNFSKRRGPNIPTSFNIRDATASEVENFFGVLDRVDANKCISRLVCEIGANPKVLEGLGHNVKEVIGSLRILEKNALSTKYRDIMMEGQNKGFSSCSRDFPTCDNKSYRMVRTFVRAFRVRN